MDRFTALLSVLVLFVTSASASLDWESSPPDGANVLACVGQEAILNWNFTLEAGDRVEDIRWYIVDERSNQMIAIFSNGNFFTMATFSGRVRHLGSARLALDHVTLTDSGNYSVEVSIHHASGTYADSYKSAFLLVAAPPATRSGELVVSQGRHAVYNNVTGDVHVQLMCGMFTSPGQPSVDVLWKTPFGSSLPSSNYDNGYFELLLDNPVEGGNYSCRLNSSSPAAVCFHDDDPMMKEQKVTVDETKARLTLIEAQQRQLKTENADLTDQLQSLKTQHHILQDKVSARVSFHASLSSSKYVSGGNPVIMNYIINNEGGSYNSTTGQFTVPRSGTYAFLTSVETSGTSFPVACVDIMMDNTRVCMTSSYHSGNHEGSSCHAVLHLVQGQRVWLRADSDSHYWDIATFFSGFLLSAD